MLAPRWLQSLDSGYSGHIKRHSIFILCVCVFVLVQILMDYQGKAVDLSEDFTVAASNVITTLAFGKEVSILHQVC